MPWSWWGIFLSSPSNLGENCYHRPLTFCHDGKIIAVITIWPNAMMGKTFNITLWPIATIGQPLSSPFNPSTWWWEQSLSSPFDSYCHDHRKNHPHHLWPTSKIGKRFITTFWSFSRMKGKIILIILWPAWWCKNGLHHSFTYCCDGVGAQGGGTGIIITLWPTAMMMRKYLSSLFDPLPWWENHSHYPLTWMMMMKMVITLWPIAMMGKNHYHPLIYCMGDGKMDIITLWPTAIIGKSLSPFDPLQWWENGYHWSLT